MEVIVNWEKAPEWANFVTIDCCGMYWWEFEPVIMVAWDQHCYSRGEGVTQGRYRDAYRDFQQEPLIEPRPQGNL